MILCAVDQSELTSSVLRHAVGFAAAMRLPLAIVHAGDPGSDAERNVQKALHRAVPYGATYLGEPLIRIEPGDPADLILRMAAEVNAQMIVLGTRTRSALSRALLGSVSADMLQRTDRPLLLIPPTDIEIVSLSHERVGVHLGVVLAAVDLAEANDEQLSWASRMAAMSRQPLELITVASNGDGSDHDVAALLRDRGRGLQPVAPKAVIVRRGDVAQEIARGALAEHSGLVVMGLRKIGRGSPGKIATALLQTHRVLVLAVPAP